VCLFVFWFCLFFLFVGVLDCVFLLMLFVLYCCNSVGVPYSLLDVCLLNSVCV